MYTIHFAKPFWKHLDKVVGNDKKLREKVMKTAQQVGVDPFYVSLRSHKVTTSKFGKVWSSWVTGDLRLIWNFDKDNRLAIFVITIGGHSGKHKVYK
jgi:mRNA-degrading endonuclease YafQ of YafQ-DinJ toxin-antitoxin module